MSDTYSVQHQNHPDHGRYVIALDATNEAEMTYRHTAKNIITIDHTGVPPAFEGRGIAAQLMVAAITDARARQWRIVPACSYVAAQFKRHPDWADCLAPSS